MCFRVKKKINVDNEQVGSVNLEFVICFSVCQYYKTLLLYKYYLFNNRLNIINLYKQTVLSKVKYNKYLTITF